MQYRADIDGLRALSVALVLLFHLGLPQVPGGFVGVDVFFVISGYLISGIIIRESAAGRFSLGHFYERRVRRILPALSLVVACCLLAGYLLLMPGEYAAAAGSAVAALAAASNIFFLLNTGYFDDAAEFMPLLHSWSLGVEEQFYLVWPLLLAGVFRLVRGKRRLLLLAVAAVTALSFGLNLWQMASAPKAAFYLPHTRAWELGAGALVALLPPLPAGAAWRSLSLLLPLAGLGLVLGAGAGFSVQTPFPGHAALLPVLGAALVLYRSGAPGPVARLLGLPPLVLLGRISYSLYLWHWPLIVFWRHYTGEARIGPAAAAGLAGAAILLAYASWRLVERPCRVIPLPRRRVFGTALAGCGALAGLALLVQAREGLPGRIPASARSLASLEAMWAWPCPHVASLGVVGYATPEQPGTACVAGAAWQDARARVILWGDSNAEHLMPLLDAAGRRRNIAIALVPECPAILRNGGLEFDWSYRPDFNQRCGKVRDSVLRALASRDDIDGVLLAALWTNLATGLHRAGERPGPLSAGRRLLEEGLEAIIGEIGPAKRVVLMNDIPGLPLARPAACALTNAALLRRRCEADMGALVHGFLVRQAAPVHEVIRAVAARHGNAFAYSPEDHLCDEERCLVSLNGEFLYRDPSHLRRNLSPATIELLAGRMRLEALLDFLAEAAPQ